VQERIPRWIRMTFCGLVAYANSEEVVFVDGKYTA
jgi:hypothetical protein